MNNAQTIFTIPTYGLRDVPETIEAYDDNFLRNSLSAKIMIFDDSSLASHQKILDKVIAVHGRVLHAADHTKDPERRQTLRKFAENLPKVFYGFEPDFFQQNVSRIVDDVLSHIRASLELWPRLVEICYYQKDKPLFPQTRARNMRIKTGQ